ncbi:YhcH/YjgK/YiaL family protein [Spiribacter sp. 1M153]|uniref:YhcH/YjgK/YiaL family protein n=1 Tax=Spiribacter roseus TaxID=1855875 RepID=UPI00349FA016
MFCAYLNDPPAWQPLCSYPVLQRSLIWLEQHAATEALGDYPLDESDWYANVHTYQTLPEPDCLWESHAQTADVQYVIAGEEGIRWLPASKLNGALRTFTDRDRLEWAPPPEDTSLLTLRAGMFAIFLPGEAHCPMIALDAPKPIRKAVVKIPLRLLES